MIRVSAFHVLSLLSSPYPPFFFLQKLSAYLSTSFNVYLFRYTLIPQELLTCLSKWLRLYYYLTNLLTASSSLWSLLIQLSFVSLVPCFSHTFLPSVSLFLWYRVFAYLSCFPITSIFRHRNKHPSLTVTPEMKFSHRFNVFNVWYIKAEFSK